MEKDTTIKPDKLEIDQFSLGFLLGILIGEGHFGGDGKQPHITLRMHVRHEQIFKWFLHLVPGSKLYGPYHHGGRNYYQWMVRGETLREKVVPLIAKTTLKYLDPYSYARFQKMVEEYSLNIPKSSDRVVIASEAKPKSRAKRRELRKEGDRHGQSPRDDPSGQIASSLRSSQ